MKHKMLFRRKKRVSKRKRVEVSKVLI